MNQEEEHYKSAYKRVELPKENKMEFFHLNCPSCDSEVPAENVNIQKNTAKCTSCNAIFSFENSFPTLREELKKPVGVEKYYFNDELEISIPEPLDVISMIILTLFPFVALFLGLLYYKKSTPGLTVAIGIVVITLAFVIFRALKNRNNKVHFVVSKNKIEVDWSANSIIKSKEFKASEIEQIYTTRTGNGYALKAILNTPQGQVHRIVIDYLKSVIICKYVEQEIEDHLGIKNKKVTGEL